MQCRNAKDRVKKNEKVGCSRTFKSLGELKIHRHPADRDEPYRLMARLYVHYEFYQWLLERDRFDDQKKDGKQEFPKAFPSTRQMANDAVTKCLTGGYAVDEVLKKKMLKAAEAYATTYSKETIKEQSSQLWSSVYYDNENYRPDNVTQAISILRLIGKVQCHFAVPERQRPGEEKGKSRVLQDL